MTERLHSDLLQGIALSSGLEPTRVLVAKRQGTTVNATTCW